MKKNIHPLLKKTTIINTDGSTYTKVWNFSKKSFKLYIDTIVHPLWKSKKKQ